MKEDEVKDDGLEEILVPTWKKAGFGVQLEKFSRDISLNTAGISKVCIVQDPVELPSKSALPFLPSTYLGEEVASGNPWNVDIRKYFSLDEKQSDVFGDAKTSDIHQSMGIIPIVEDTPKVAESKLSSNSSEITDSKGSKSANTELLDKENEEKQMYRRK